MKAVGNELKVAKKTLLGMTFKKAGLEIELKKIKGEISVIFGLKDEFSPAKLAYQFSQENQNLKILGGYFEKKVRTAEEITALAQLPSKEELLAKLLGSIKAPVSGFVSVLNGNLRNLVYILSKAKPSI
jgi:large subunit ribosomal protein L10